MRVRVVVLMGRSLFAAGVISRMQQHQNKFDLQVVDSRQPNAVAQVMAIQPFVVILDEADPESRHCSLDELLTALPSLRVIRLNPQSDQIQVIQWEWRQATEVHDLIQAIDWPDARMPRTSPGATDQMVEPNNLCEQGRTRE